MGYDWRNDKTEWDLGDSWQSFSVAALKFGSISRYARVKDMGLANANHTYSFELSSGIDVNRDDGTGGLGPGNLALSDSVGFVVARLPPRLPPSTDNGNVTFMARAGEVSGGESKQIPLKLSQLEFTRRWCLHVLPAGFTRTRRYGGWANTRRGVES